MADENSGTNPGGSFWKGFCQYIGGAIAAGVLAIFVAVAVGLWDLIKDLGPKGLPRNAVVAFYTSVDEAPAHEIGKHCPDGWSPFEEGRGRFLVGAGEPTHEDFKNWNRQILGEDEAVKLVPTDLSSYKPFQIAGEEEHTLRVDAMPSHRHRIAVQQNPGKEISISPGDASGGAAKTPHPRFTEYKGTGKPHNNMPPYIALYFCKKG